METKNDISKELGKGDYPLVSRVIGKIFVIQIARQTFKGEKLRGIPIPSVVGYYYVSNSSKEECGIEYDVYEYISSDIKLGDSIRRVGNNIIQSCSGCAYSTQDPEFTPCPCINFDCYTNKGYFTFWNSVDNPPTNTFQCIVKMYNKCNDTWELGIGIYDIPTKKWEIVGYNGEVNVKFWIEADKLSQPLPLSFWKSLSKEFYEEKVAHHYKDGKFDYSGIYEWFINHSNNH